MPTLNPEALPEELLPLFELLIAENTDPMALALAAWNACARYEQGERLDLRRSE
jgi:hypothetical protein